MRHPCDSFLCVLLLYLFFFFVLVLFLPQLLFGAKRLEKGGRGGRIARTHPLCLFTQLTSVIRVSNILGYELHTCWTVPFLLQFPRNFFAVLFLFCLRALFICFPFFAFSDSILFPLLRSCLHGRNQGRN